VFKVKGKKMSRLPVITKIGGQRSHEMAMSGVQICRVFQEQVFHSFFELKWHGMVTRMKISKDWIRDMNCIRIRHCSTLKLKQV